MNGKWSKKEFDKLNLREYYSYQLLKKSMFFDFVTMVLKNHMFNLFLSRFLKIANICK
jgi:hypothetical protein